MRLRKQASNRNLKIFNYNLRSHHSSYDNTFQRRFLGKSLNFPFIIVISAVTEQLRGEMEPEKDKETIKVEF